MADTRKQPGQSNPERKGGQGSETERERGDQGGNVNEPERQANPRRTQEEIERERTGGTGTERGTETDPGRQNAG